MTPDRNVLVRTTLLATTVLATGLLMAGATAADAAENRLAAPTSLAPAALDQHAAAVAAVVQAQLGGEGSAEDQKQFLALVKSLLATRQHSRSDVAARAIQPLTRREAAGKGLASNLALAIGRAEPERIQTLQREAGAVFDPVLDLSLGYNRADSYRRQKIGTVKPKSVTTNWGGLLGETYLPISDDPLAAPTALRRLNTCKVPFYSCADTGKPVVRAVEFYQNTDTTPVQEEIVANAGRASLNSGHPLQKINVSIGLTQELPWGGSLQLTDNTIQQRIYYDPSHYWEDGQFSSSLNAALSMPLPFTKGFGQDNPDNISQRNAAIARERADWVLKDLVNQTVRNVDIAYFEVVRALEALRTTVESRGLILQLKERQDRILKQDPGLVTRYQEAQITGEVTKADIQVEQALQAYLSASVSLAQVIGDPDARAGSAIYLPYAYSRDLETPMVTSLEGALAMARANRPDFYLATLDRASADAGLALARNQALPDVQVKASTALTENGSTYGYADPLQSQMRLGRPDSITQNYGLTFTRPWGNRAAEAAVDIARLSVEDRAIASRDTEARVKREITSDLAAVQTARARQSHSTAEAKSLQAAYESLERQLGAGLVAEDQVIQASRSLLSARLNQLSAKVDNREAETTLLYAQGTIANVLPAQTAQSALDQRRLSLLADAGYLKYFGPETAPNKTAEKRK